MGCVEFKVCNAVQCEVYVVCRAFFSSRLPAGMRSLWNISCEKIYVFIRQHAIETLKTYSILILSLFWENIWLKFSKYLRICSIILRFWSIFPLIFKEFLWKICTLQISSCLNVMREYFPLSLVCKNVHHSPFNICI